MKYKFTTFLALLACHPAFAAVIDDAVLWKNKEINVCVASHAASVREISEKANVPKDEIGFQNYIETDPIARDQKVQYIQKIVTASALVREIGFRFRGWNSCDDPSAYRRADVVLVIQNSTFQWNPFGEASIGDDSSSPKKFVSLGLQMDFVNETSRLLGYYKSDVLETLFKNQIHLVAGDLESRWLTSELSPAVLKKLNTNAVILHEFGHLLGMLHEQVRPERSSPGAVREIAIHAAYETNFSRPVNTYQTQYDPMSEMTYGFNEDASYYALLRVSCAQDPTSLSESLRLLCPKILTVLPEAEYSLNDRVALSKAYKVSNSSQLAQSNYESVYFEILLNTKR